MKKFKDYFSNQAEKYSQYRPTYPRELFQFIASKVPEQQIAWDCATGNGQAAVALTEYFDKVIATDASEEQIKHAIAHPKIHYETSPAEKTRIVDKSIDLVTVAQAIHWFDFEKFYQEVRRVVKPNGIIAVWCYPLLVFDDSNIQELLEEFYYNDIVHFWPVERKYVDNHYRDLPFPFEEIQCSNFKIQLRWSREVFIEYLQTWSAVQQYSKVKQYDPVIKILCPKLKKFWQTADQKKSLSFEVHLRMSRVI